MKIIALLINFLCILVLFPFTCDGQINRDLKYASTLFVPEKKVNYSELAKGSKNEIESTFSLVFLFYKKFISSQDIDACVFYPSCSVYAIECIHHEKSKIVAVLKISDRLLRCHPLQSKNSYKIDKLTGKFFDPIEN